MWGRNRGRRRTSYRGRARRPSLTFYLTISQGRRLEKILIEFIALFFSRNDPPDLLISFAPEVSIPSEPSEAAEFGGQGFSSDRRLFVSME